MIHLLHHLAFSLFQCRPVFPADVDACDGAQQEETAYDDSHETRCPTGSLVDSFNERNTKILVSKCGISLAYKDYEGAHVLSGIYVILENALRLVYSLASGKK
jgi:hypothetical protein